MAAVMEINILSRHFIGIKDLINIISDDIQVEMTIENMEVMDNWEYENQDTLCMEDNILKYVEDKKIITSYFIVDGKHKSGCQIEKIENEYLFCVWIDTLYLKYLDSCVVNKENRNVYELITNEIVKCIDRYNIRIAAIGVETNFVFDEDVFNIINKSSNVIKWIVPYFSNPIIEGYCFEKIVDLCIAFYTKND